MSKAISIVKNFSTATAVKATLSTSMYAATTNTHATELKELKEEECMLNGSMEGDGERIGKYVL